MLFFGPLAIRWLRRRAPGCRLPVRLAVTDLVRYQARAGRPLAAISLALGICAAIVIGSAAAEQNACQARRPGQPCQSHLLIRIGEPEPVIPERTPAQVAALQSQADAIGRGHRWRHTDPAGHGDRHIVH